MEGETLRDALDEIALINRWLGGNRITLKGVQSLLKNVNRETAVHIWDLGCGNGDLLRIVADWRKNQCKLSIFYQGKKMNDTNDEYTLLLPVLDDKYTWYPCVTPHNIHSYCAIRYA